MHIKSILISYLLTFVVFLMIDLLWLGIIAKNLYQKYLGEFLSDKVNWTAAFIFYFIYVAGISFFAIYPSVHKESVFNAILLGALFGLFTYATYDLTNLATLKGWPLPIVFIDILWGVSLSAIVSLSGFYIVKWIN
ncbi:DUF2177 family protein [Ancylomarina euxinus]|uniref:DUF2177 family protein n=1 Tax=Ancylomarina euxinus TaxID=2283627 RepID=A0A425Y461_9BACT|nr:DUF2177 family protein [Ancylomarina euxinus]MCZ4694680.1 DUF2177 family protein [Ancylomarina euxinus]MUP14224.1 DUF2177 family protein [Ancylomarina euxinus]RRG23075.1 DUF2177 family protein [Ancylomarina euxinus]